MQQYPEQYRPTVPGGSPPRARRRYRSLFWAVVLIGAGIIWLLFSLGVFSEAEGRMLSLLWPILLVGIGLDLLLGRRSLVIGAIVGAVVIGLVVVLMVVGAQAGWVQGGELQTRSLTSPVGQATSAEVTVRTGPYSANVHALEMSTGTGRPLIAADIAYRGSVRFESTGGPQSNVILEARGQGWWFPWWEDVAERWDIGLDPSLPIDLRYSSSAGSSSLDLSGLTLSRVSVDMSSGDADVRLPQGSQQYATELHLSSGDLSVEVADGAGVDMNIGMSSGDAEVVLGTDCDGTVQFDSSSGEFVLRLAAGQAYRVEVQQVSSGDVDLPSGLVQVSGGDDEEGTWETQGYANASRKVLVTIEISSGDVTVRQGD